MNFEKYRQEIESQINPFIAIKLAAKDDFAPWESKFGGFPDFPKAIEYPRSPQGNPLYLLAQINFAEVPPLARFPTRGILQFYIGDDEFYGCNFDEPRKQEGFRVLYFPEIETNPDRLIQDFSFLPPPEFFPLPINRAFSLEFSRQNASITTLDEESGEIFSGEFIAAGEEDSEFDENGDAALEDEHSNLHRLGGIPHFTQSDPRVNLPPMEEPYILLLQIDSDCELDILWGDVGIANFFIQESALKRLDFSNVLYNWDCG